LSTDSQLAEQAAAGDREAFEQLLERQYARIFALSMRALGDPDDAADLTQDVCRTLASKVRSFGRRSSFETWLFSVVHNAAVDWKRRMGVRQRLGERFAQAQMSDGAAAESTPTDEATEQTAWLYQTLPGLDDDLRWTALFVLQEGLTHEQTATVLNVRPATISWRMAEIRRRLRAMAKAEEAADERAG